MHIPNYRFSISWSRIFPEGTGTVNQAGVDFYNQLIDAMPAEWYSALDYIISLGSAAGTGTKRRMDKPGNNQLV